MKNLLVLVASLVFSTSVFAAKESIFATIWRMNSGGGAEQRAEANIADQSAALLDMWRAGIVENVYMNTEKQLGYGGSFVFFIKAKNEAHARELLSEMPFVKNKVSEYEIHHVGTRWLGRYEVNN